MERTCSRNFEALQLRGMLLERRNLVQRDIARLSELLNLLVPLIKLLLEFLAALVGFVQLVAGLSLLLLVVLCNPFPVLHLPRKLLLPSCV